MTDLIERARAWIAGDPDPATRSELEALIASGDRAELSNRLDYSLEFGTAGLRGAVGAGPNRMNLAVVIRATAGLAGYLQEGPRGPVIVGFDARPDSRDFAEAASGVLCAHGFRVRYFPEPTPTPLVAFATKHLGAVAAVVITASHNPPGDNGYKVYDRNAAQIIPPTDTEIRTRIGEVGPADQVPRRPHVFAANGPLASPIGSDLFDSYWTEVSAARSRAQGSDLRVAYTPLHGVGGKHLATLFDRAGHRRMTMVEEQADPDGTFPTVSFPNPEEPGTLDLALELGAEIGAQLILANDPDADRLAVAVSLPEGGFRQLSGNDVGVLLGDYLLGGHHSPRRPIVASSVVSTPMMRSVAVAHSARHAVTLTGFKWIVNAGLALEKAGEGRFVFGFEEALGYSVGGVVHDKDGLSAALLFTDLVADLEGRGETALDRLVALWEDHGLWASAQVSIPGDRRDLVAAVARLGSEPPTAIEGHQVVEMTDFRRGEETRPPWLGKQDLIELSLGETGRMLVRPSGTEPKLKIYADLRAAPGEDPLGQQDRLQEQAAGLGRALAGELGL